MKIITCFKLVPEEQDIVVTPDYTLNFDNTDAKISQFDLNAIEAANLLAGDGDEIVALTVGGSLLQNSKVRKDVLSRGPHSLYMVQDAQLEHALPVDTAKALAAAAEKIGFDLLIFGEGSGDLYAQQVGLLVGEMLQLPVINAVSAIQRQGNTLVVERTLEDEVEVIELSVPAVLCVTSDINVPRIPSMKAILGAGKKPVNQWQVSDIGWSQSAPLAELTGIRVPPQTERKHIIFENDSPEVCLSLLEQQRCTCMLGATPFVYDLLNLLEKQPTDLSALRFFLCGGTTIPQKVMRECQQRGIKLLSVYGSTESSPHAVVNLDDPLSRFMHTDGYAAAGVEIKVVDDERKTLPPGCEGEEASRGPNVFMGYLDEPELTAHTLDNDGWYYSGDLCRMDEAGYIKITGRKKDIIVRGGENISSREVEDILLQHPKIHDACVVAMPDERLGERSCAYIVLKSPHHSLSLEEVVAFFSRKRVAKYKYPEHIVVIEKLPRTASGKIQKFLLRKDIIRRLTQDYCESTE